MHYSRDKTSQLNEVYSYLVIPTDTRWSCGEFEGPSDENMICKFHLNAIAKGTGDWILPRGTKRRGEPCSLRVKMGLIGIQSISMGPDPVMLHIFMTSSSSEVWGEKQHISEKRVQFTVWVRCPLSQTVQVQRRAKLLSAAGAVQMNKTASIYPILL